MTPRQANDFKRAKSTTRRRTSFSHGTSRRQSNELFPQYMFGTDDPLCKKTFHQAFRRRWLLAELTESSVQFIVNRTYFQVAAARIKNTGRCGFYLVPFPQLVSRGDSGVPAKIDFNLWRNPTPLKTRIFDSADECCFSYIHFCSHRLHSFCVAITVNNHNRCGSSAECKFCEGIIVKDGHRHWVFQADK